MNIRCKQDVLLNSINTVLKACSTKTTMPILECILLKAYNGEVTFCLLYTSPSPRDTR